MLAKPSVPRGVLWTAIAVLVPTGVRWLIDAGGNGVPCVTYFPAILLAALLLDWRYGAATAVLSGIVVNRFLRAEPLQFDDPRALLIMAMYAVTCAILIYVAAVMRRLVRDQAEAATREAVLNLELLHRVKNMLATVSSIATMTVRHSDPEDFIDAFSGRIAALSRASELLASGKEVHCDIRRLVETAIGPFRNDRNFMVEGPDSELPRESCVPLSLALYELCTNASKYGALSVPGGRVRLEWTATEGERATIRWREEGGPPVSGTRGTGMGSRLLRPQPGLAGVRHEFHPDGVRCDFEIEWIEPARS